MTSHLKSKHTFNALIISCLLSNCCFFFLWPKESVVQRRTASSAVVLPPLQCIFIVVSLLPNEVCKFSAVTFTLMEQNLVRLRRWVCPLASLTARLQELLLLSSQSQTGAGENQKNVSPRVTFHRIPSTACLKE